MKSAGVLGLTGKVRGVMRRLIGVVVLAMVAGGVAGGVVVWWWSTRHVNLVGGGGGRGVPVQLVGHVPAPENFVYAAQRARPAVVHIRVVEEETAYIPYFNPFSEDFWNWYPYRRHRERSGSGVIISSSGHIVTNLHVVGRSGRILVTLWDKRVLEAERVGYDPMTDLALIKVDASHLPYIEFGNSDEVRVGEWVLAVGNPFNLESTVTAGIVSAKGRNLNIIKERFALRSFIQTDAAVNPGNSGGALVNLRGELIGINIAIATPTGVYAGYAFAVPGNIVRKVVRDIMQYGYVRRAYLGVAFTDVPGDLLVRYGIRGPAGALIDSVFAGSPAARAGIRSGDIIVSLNGKKLESSAELQEQIAQRDPGDTIQLEILREGSRRVVTVVLAELGGSSGGVVAGGRASGDASSVKIRDVLGIEVEPIGGREARRLGISGGLRVRYVDPKGVVARYTGIRPGFIILEVNGEPVHTVEDLQEALARARGTVTLKGFYPGSAQVYYYGFPI